MRRIREEYDSNYRVQTEVEDVDTTHIMKSEKTFSFVISSEVRILLFLLNKTDIF